MTEQHINYITLGQEWNDTPDLSEHYQDHEEYHHLVELDPDYYLDLLAAEVEAELGPEYL